MPGSSHITPCSIRRWLNPLIVMCALIVWNVCMPLSAQAQGSAQSVRYERRDYAVKILPTGDISMVEHWQVHFTGGPFYHAALQIYLAHTTGIDFGPVSGATDGTQQVTDIRGTWDNPMRRVDWDFPRTQDASRSFEIPYTIHGALGIGTEQAWLDWHFLIDRSEDSFTPYWPSQGTVVDESTITLTLPAMTKVSDLSVKASDWMIPPDIHIVDATTARVRYQHIQQILHSPIEIVAAFPLSEIDASVQPQPWQKTNRPPTPPTTFQAQLQYLIRTPSDPYSSPPSLLPLVLIGILYVGLILAIAAARDRWSRRKSQQT